MIPSLLYSDRYRNVGTRTYSQHADYTEAKNAYRPDSSFQDFALPCYLIPADTTRLYLANPPENLLQTYIKDKNILFCVHPQVINEFQNDRYCRHLLANATPAPPLTVVPSSSTRTLYVLHNNTLSHAVKVHFPLRVSRYERKMRDEVIEQAINVSLELESGVQRLDSSFAFLREVIGIVHAPLEQAKTGRTENWGFVVRDMRPFPFLEGEYQLLPGFALFGKDFFDPQKPLLLFELIGKADPVSFILEHIMLPIVSHWVSCFLHFGYMMEPHGQNTLLEIVDGKIRRIVHRDLSVGIDMRLRRNQHLSADNLNMYNRMENGQFSSITYDMFMGSHFFERIISCCKSRYPRVRAEDFRTPCRETFARLFPDHRAYLPSTIHYFSEQRDAFNKPLYADTGKRPVWRP